MLRHRAFSRWLDAQKNVRRTASDNRAREVLELFTLGVGAYTEADVKAGARVLTGWQVDRATGKAHLVPRRHDDRPVELLGGTVDDVDRYADLIVRQEHHVPFLAGRMWARYGGP